MGVVYPPGKLGFKLTVTSFNDLDIQNRLDSIHDAVSIIRDSSQKLHHSHPHDKPLAGSEKGQPLSNFSQSLDAIDALMAQLTAMKIRIEKQDDKTESPMDSWDNFEDVKRASLPLMLLQSKVREALQLLSTPQPGHEKLADIDVQSKPPSLTWSGCPGTALPPDYILCLQRAPQRSRTWHSARSTGYPRWPGHSYSIGTAPERRGFA